MYSTVSSRLSPQIADRLKSEYFIGYNSTHDAIMHLHASLNNINLWVLIQIHHEASIEPCPEEGTVSGQSCVRRAVPVTSQ